MGTLSSERWAFVVAWGVLPDLGLALSILAKGTGALNYTVAKGSAKILAFNGSILVGTLDVDTKNLRRVSITFNFVEDDADKNNAPSEALELGCRAELDLSANAISSYRREKGLENGPRERWLENG
jgi:hypothetical protein